MHVRSALIATGSALLILGTALGVQSSTPSTFREYPAREYNNFPIPADYQDPAEWVFARLMYPDFSGAIGPMHGYRGGYGRRFGSNWKEGRTSWTTDYPRADRHLSVALRRLTRVHVRSVEQPVDLDVDNDVFNYPWLYAVEVGHWELTDEQVKKMREYLDRGGFFMCDDFHGTEEWAVFIASMQRVFPDRPIVDLPSSDAIFHSVYDLEHRYQVPGAQYLRSGRTYEYDGYEPHWRGIYDDKGRLVVAICNDMDLGDSWEWADDPKYDEKFSAMGFRIAANYVVYSMSH
jgi:hypothetical protein